MAIRGFFTPANLVAMTWLYQAKDGATPSGFAQIECEPANKLWHLVEVAPEANHQDATQTAWKEILEHLARQAVIHGVEQIHTHPTLASLEEQTLVQSGFHRAYGELMLSLARPIPDTPRPSDMHPFVLTGKWQLGELYRSSVPAPIRGILMRSSLSPVESVPPARPGLRVAEWVAVQDEQPYAYFCLTSNRTVQWLDVLVRPDRRGDILEHLKYLASLGHPGPDRPLCCIVPDYGIGTAWLLRQIGFGDQGEYSLVVKQLAVKVCASDPLRASTRAALQYGDASSSILPLHRRMSAHYGPAGIDRECEYALGDH